MQCGTCDNFEKFFFKLTEIISWNNIGPAVSTGLVGLKFV